jgi:hypothetical protein
VSLFADPAKSLTRERRRLIGFGRHQRRVLGLLYLDGFIGGTVQAKCHATVRLSIRA